jgi:hypothetical protein
LQAQPVAGQPASLPSRSAAVMQPQHAAIGLLQLQQRALPDQRCQRRPGVQRQGGDRPLEAEAVDLLDAIEGFGDQHIGATRRMQSQGDGRRGRQRAQGNPLRRRVRSHPWGNARRTKGP